MTTITPGQVACALIAIILMVTITCIFVMLERRDEDPYYPGPATVPDDVPWPPEIHHEELPAPGFLAMQPILPDPPPAETGPLPMITCELGQTIDDYLDQLFATQDDQVTT